MKILNRSKFFQPDGHHLIDLASQKKNRNHYIVKVVYTTEFTTDYFQGNAGKRLRENRDFDFSI